MITGNKRYLFKCLVYHKFDVTLYNIICLSILQGFIFAKVLILMCRTFFFFFFFVDAHAVFV